jgi:hypothetical protein
MLASSKRRRNLVLARAMELTITAPTLANLRLQGRVIDRVQVAAMHKAVDRATSLAQKAGQQRARAVGLGRLAGAIGATSSEKKKRRDPNNAWGAIFARGGDDSRAGGALEAYTKGATIRGINVTWLAIATKALPKRIGRFRTTPERYEAAGSPLGPLIFHQISANRAVLIIQGDFNVSRKTGKAKAFAGRATRSAVRKRDVIAFVLIRVTRRMQRFSQEDLTRIAASKVPDFMAEEQAKSLPGTFESGGA